MPRGRKPTNPFGNIKTRKEMRDAVVELLKDNGVSEKIAEVLNLDNKEDQKAVAVGLLAAGYTGSQVAKQLGFKETTLWNNYYRILGPASKDRHDRRKQSDARIEVGAAAVTEGILAEMLHDMESEDVRLSPADKAKYFAAGNKALERLRERASKGGEGDGAQWQEIFQKMAGDGGTIKIDLEPRKLVDIPREVNEIGDGESELPQ